MNQVTETSFALGGILFFLIVSVVALLGFAFWVWMLIHASINRGLSDTEKLIWVVLIVFLPFLGSVIYFFVGRPKHRPGS